jgi:hypothetical protein
MIVKISFPTYLEDITDIENDNIDVFVELEDGYTHIVTVATTKNIESLMDEDKMNYFRPNYPFIIVKKLTKDIIEETLKAYAEEDDGYWLKLYHFANDINKTVFEQLQAEHIKESEEFDELNRLDDLQAEYLKKKELGELDKEYLKEYLKELEKLDESDKEYLKEYQKELDELNRLNGFNRLDGLDELNRKNGFN